MVKLRRARRARAVSGIEVRLTAERWRHIVNRHPELTPFHAAVLQTIGSPDLVAKGLVGELIAVKRIPHVPFKAKYLVVAYKELQTGDGFVITAHFISNAERLLRREVVWRKKFY